MVALAALPKIQIVRKIVLALAVLSFTLMFALTSSAQAAGSPDRQTRLRTPGPDTLASSEDGETFDDNTSSKVFFVSEEARL